MGQLNSGGSTGGGGGGSTGGTGNIDLLNALNSILAVLIATFGLGASFANTTVYSGATTTPTALIPGVPVKAVKRAIIQNLSATDNMTVFAAFGSGGGANTSVVAGKGTVLNKAPAAGQGGGTLTVANVNLSDFTIITDTNTGQSYSIYSET